jgi:hypothetical protein
MLDTPVKLPTAKLAIFRLEVSDNVGCQGDVSDSEFDVLTISFIGS